MIETIEDHFTRRVREWSDQPPPSREAPAELVDAFAAQLASRHLDLAARRLQQEGDGYYTIGSAGHESNALVAMALRHNDPALLHYRAGGFYCARAMQVDGHDAVRDVLLSLMASSEDPISGGRHKVFGNPDLHVIPQTSTIASQLPRAVGLAFAIGRGAQLGVESPWPEDAVVVTSLGDASANHSTAVGALNAAGHAAFQGVPMPLLVVCEDNGIGISVRTPDGWTAANLSNRPGFVYRYVDGADPVDVLRVSQELVSQVRTQRVPAILHLRTIRLMGHAGSDAEIGYRSAREIEADYDQDPVLQTAAALVGPGLLSVEDVLAADEATRDRVWSVACALRPVDHLDDAAEVTAPIRVSPQTAHEPLQLAPESLRRKVFRNRLPEDAGSLTLAQAINSTLADLLASVPEAIVFGEDVGVKGGVYGVTHGLRRAFGALRVFDTLLDEQAILGTALGAGVAGYLPIPEIQYLAYLHNAEDQLRGEGASLPFFSNGHYDNPMIVRVAGLAYQKGFGGHFHNDNSVAVLTDIPGIVVGVPSRAAEAPGMIRTMARMALGEHRMCVLLEPIALYHTRDLHDGDGAWTAPYQVDEDSPLGTGHLHRGGDDVLIVTFGNGVAMSLRAASRARAHGGPEASVFDLRWLAPLPVDDLLQSASRFAHVLVVDETRHSGGVGQAIVSELVSGGYPGTIRRICSVDSYVPIGPAAATVLLSEDDIVIALKEITHG